MREFKAKYSTHLDVLQYIGAAKQIPENDKLLWVQFVVKYRRDVEIPWFDRADLKAVADFKEFRLYMGQWQLKRDKEVWQQQVMALLIKDRKLWRMYSLYNWEAEVYLDGIIKL